MTFGHEKQMSCLSKDMGMQEFLTTILLPSQHFMLPLQLNVETQCDSAFVLPARHGSPGAGTDCGNARYGAVAEGDV